MLRSIDKQSGKNCQKLQLMDNFLAKPLGLSGWAKMLYLLLDSKQTSCSFVMFTTRRRTVQ